MKTILIYLMCAVFCTPLLAQEFDLPAYTAGVYRRDTVQSFFLSNDLNFSVGNTVENNFVTGVSFKLLVDSLQFPGASSAGGSTIHKGDIFPFPVAVQVFNGVIRARIIVEGIPQTIGESYLCDLGLIITTGTGPTDDAVIVDLSSATCMVSSIQGNNEAALDSQKQFYPNPFSSSTELKVDDFSSGDCILLLFDKQGTLLLSQPAAQGKVQLNKNNLPNGMYFYQLKNEQTVLTTGKLMVE
jgi:hypothetical protein